MNVHADQNYKRTASAMFVLCNLLHHAIKSLIIQPIKVTTACKYKQYTVKEINLLK